MFQNIVGLLLEGRFSVVYFFKEGGEGLISGERISDFCGILWRRKGPLQQSVFLYRL